ncbi:MAG TPA: hypothetical protein VGE50_08020 [Gammaproteobacteria bacterium]
MRNKILGRCLALVWLLLALAGCDDNKKVDDPPANTSSTVSMKVVQNKTYSGPSYALVSSAASLFLWTDYYGDLDAALFEGADGQTIRMTTDATTGHLNKVVDESSGAYVVVNPRTPDRVDYLFYDATNHYQDGYAVLVENSRVYVAHITTYPALEGQINGQLNGSLRTGSYAVIAEQGNDLEQKRELTAAQYDMLNALVAMQASYKPLAGSVTPSYASSFTGTLGVLADNLPEIGSILVGTAVAGTLVSGGTGSPALAPLGLAGMAFIFAGKGAAMLDNWIAQRFDETDVQSQSLLDTALAYVVDSKRDIANFSSELVENVGNFTDSTVNTVKSKFKEEYSLDALDGNYPYDPASWNNPVPVDGPTKAITNLVGQAVQQDGDVYQVSGQIDANGTIKLSGITTAGTPGETLTISASKDAGNNISGLFVSSDGNSGTVDGSVSAIGSCNSSTGSGGQGTFSFAHYVGAGSGSVNFFYDAYSIPDAFTVSTSSGQKFTTGGLVSGSQSVDIALADEPLVFVSVSAPESGTAWEYTLGCLETGTTTPIGGSSESEPNNGAAEADAISTGTVTGSADSTLDSDDIFIFTPQSSGYYALALGGFTGDLDLYLYDGNGYEVASSTNFSGSESLTYYLQAGMSYYVDVYAYSTSGASSYTLTLTAN